MRFVVQVPLSTRMAWARYGRCRRRRPWHGRAAWDGERTVPARASSARALPLPRNGLIAFVAAGGGIGVISENGRGLRLLTRDRRDAHPAWSPDGTRLLFARGKDLQLIRADGSAATAPDARLCRRDLITGRQRIAFIRDGDLFVIGADGNWSTA